ncbi:MAG: hypothetical protein H0X31_00325 [Nostocaceae cyanobacterium]|nr:hypothetical protein [Nostocaceae cyanobacterium]
MTVKISRYQLEQIKKLPPEMIMWASKYPVEIVNLAESLDDDELPSNYVPEMLEVYYGVQDSPSIFVHNGVLKDFDMETARKQNPSVSVMVDDRWVYIEIEGNILLNKINGIILPDVSIDQTKVSI